MTEEQELEPIEVEEAKEAVKTGIFTGESLLREGTERRADYNYWERASFTALEPLPVHQEHFHLKCCENRGPTYFRLREGVHLLRQALRAMDDPEFRVDDPSVSYRRLIMSLPD